jgi:hypothetical protein
MSEKQSTIEPGPVLTYEVNDDEELSEGVVSAVAAVSNTDPAVMEPLARSIDPDALNALFADQYDGTPRESGTARFAFLGYELVVTGDGLVTVLDSA